MVSIVLTKRQKETLARHAAHHTKKHMQIMRKEMLKGKTFFQAHIIATRNIGK